MKTLAFVLAIAVAAPASAAWRRVDSPNFIVAGDLNAGDLSAIARKFEVFSETLRRVLRSAAVTSPVPTVVIVFPNDEAFTPYKPLYQGRAKAFLAGYAAAGRDVNYIAMVNEGEATDRVIFHEYTHMVVANAVARVPVWLNEGLAVWAEETEEGERQSWAEQTIAGQELFTLEQLSNSFIQLPIERAEVAYAQGYLAVRALIDEYGTRKIPALLGNLASRGGRVATTALLAATLLLATAQY